MKIEVIGIDHGWMMMKTPNYVFRSGIREISKEPPFFHNILEYNGVYYEIEIFAIDKAAANKIISNITICNELKELVDKVMSSYFQLERTLCQPTPNVDKNIYRITMRYTANIWDNKNMLI